MRTIPLLLLLPLLPSSSRWTSRSSSFPRQTQTWRAPGTWWQCTDDFNKESNTAIPRPPAPPLLSAKHPLRYYSTIPGPISQPVSGGLRRLQKRKICFPRSFPKTINNLAGWMRIMLHHAKHLRNRRSWPGYTRLSSYGPGSASLFSQDKYEGGRKK